MTNRESKVFIVGAGALGRKLAEMIQRGDYSGNVVAFLDDDPQLRGQVCLGVPVLGPIADAIGILEHTHADEAIIALSDDNMHDLKRIYEILKKADFEKIRIMNQHPLDENNFHLNTRDLDPEDLLLREPVDVNLSSALEYVKNKRIVVTGAGGTIGGELCRQLLYGQAKRIYLLEKDENGVYEIHKELLSLQQKGVGVGIAIVPIIADLLDTDHISFLMQRLKANIIFHCAAHKHVPMIEANPIEGIKNNFFGSKNIIDAAIAAKVDRFINISTDKAVAPNSIYGVSKKMIESYVHYQHSQGHNCKAVRFGNVLGSRGSFIPLFKEQILQGGPVTVTHPQMKRYFMTITEAVSLVLWAGGSNDDKGFYLLDMSEPISIVDIAKTLISFYGKKDVKIVYTGLRQGEKLSEELHENDEILEESDQLKVFLLSGIQEIDILKIIAKITPLCFLQQGKEVQYRNKKLLRETLKQDFPHLVIDDVTEY